MDLLVLVPYEKAALEQLQSAAGQMRVVPGDGLTGEALREQLAQAEVVIGQPPLELLGGLPQLNWIQMTWAGADYYTMSGRFPEHIALTSAAGAYGVTISEHVLAMALALCRRLPAYGVQQRAQLWRDAGPELPLEGKTAVIIGTGDIGRETAKRLRAFGVRCVGVRRKAQPVEGFDEVITAQSLAQWLPRAGLVIGCAPDTPQTRGILGAAELALTPPECILINVGRGTLVDTGALVQALREGRLAGAGLDVMDPEPLPPEHPLWQMENVILTPHIAGVAARIMEKIHAIALDNLRRYRAGEPLRNRMSLTTCCRES